MRRIRHTDPPGRFNHSAFAGVSEVGDEHTVEDGLAEYLVGDGPFEDTDEIVLDDDEYEVVEESEDEGDDLSELTKSELYDRATEADIDGRSTMSKAELIDALTEA